MAKLNAYSRLDQTVHRIAFSSRALQLSMADMEDSMFAKDLAGITVRRPIFVTALPRAGTTILLTALAHLRATILYFIDISQQCGYTIAQQCSLFDSIAPLFQGKPLIVVMTKIDVQDPNDLDLDDQKRIQQVASPCQHRSRLTAVRLPRGKVFCS